MFKTKGYSTKNLQVSFRYSEPQFYDDGSKNGTMIEMRSCILSDGVDLNFATSQIWVEVGAEKERTRKQLLKLALERVYPGKEYRKYRETVWRAYFERKDESRLLSLQFRWKYTQIKEATFWQRFKLWLKMSP